VATIERSPSLADLSVTPYPYPAWTYTSPDAFPGAGDDPTVDGVRFICGNDESVGWDASGCGEAFYLSFVRYEDGEPVEPDRVPERVSLAGDGPSTSSPPDAAGPSA
jgi:hypothetical protein